MLTAETLMSSQQRVKNLLEKEVEQLDTLDADLKDALKYALLMPGKCIRPHIIYEIGTLFGCPKEALDPLAVAVECIHTYSLVHDDLPCMDDDALRRGQPTTHIKFNEATAILVGDALQALAFEILSRPIAGISASQNLKALHILAKASGYQGMCGGQALDIWATEKEITLSQLIDIHEKKTGALIQVSAEMACIIAQASTEETQKIKHFARCLGHAFQIQDDILDITSTTLALGKPQGSDTEANKSTYPKLMGLNEAQQHAKSLIDEASSLLQTLSYNTQSLDLFATYMIQRIK